MPLLKAHLVSKDYASGTETVSVLQEVSMSLSAKTTCSIVGPSGSGKTTLLGLCAGLDVPTSGTITFDGVDLQTLTENERAAQRRQHVGFIFQNFQLVPSLTALENVMVPLELLSQRHCRDEAKALLDKVGLRNRLDHYPLQLSGGEQQRVAIARAFIHNPKVLFADEPTGNLDATTSHRVVEMLFRLNEESGTAILMVTHDSELARQTDQTLTMNAGRLV